jgi:hypothetical protein
MPESSEPGKTISISEVKTVELTKTKELKLRIKIWKELKLFMKEGTDISYLETGPAIFYNSHRMAKTLEIIITQIKAL